MRTSALTENKKYKLLSYKDFVSKYIVCMNIYRENNHKRPKRMALSNICFLVKGI